MMKSWINLKTKSILEFVTHVVQPTLFFIVVFISMYTFKAKNG